MTKFMPWYRDYVIKVTHNNTVCHTIDFLSSHRTRSTWHEIHPESFVHNVILLRFTGFNKIRFTYPRSLNNRASRIDKASVEALALDRAPLISRPAPVLLAYLALKPSTSMKYKQFTCNKNGLCLNSITNLLLPNSR